MAAGRRWRRVWWLSALVFAVLGVSAFIFRDELTLSYHKNRLLAAKERHWRLTTKGYSKWDHIVEVVRRKPVSADEVARAWQRHEDALVRRGFLRRETYLARNGLLPSRSANPEYNQLLARMEASCPWWSALRVGTNLVVTGCERGLADWKRQAGEAGLKPQSDGPDPVQKQKKRCWRKRKNSRSGETLAGRGPSGYTVDDEFVRKRIFKGDAGSAFAGHQP